ncbi:MAG TPA: Hsp33 family molecular chaperone HslO [Pseudomonas xinjiangensis]|uniref:33 kDa chaperonin n=2 Tax=root TaxID=1 RepID=A0A7V1BNE9_9GAMM|nr:Hsp33 family molecular chaperone HslO [Halopseudomonas xinjiangensis]HEC48561.1 Hsp33 family molecular chaperone HslO [Halopseudomonas xinjiangensis]
MQLQDVTQRFLFEEADVRGELVSLDQSYREVLAKHEYPESVKALLGEMLAAAVLLSTAIKFDGLLILQARSSGPLSMLMVECSSAQEVRGIARYADDITGESLSALMPDGVLAITIDPDQGQRYQGIVALEGATLADALNSYFENSEQLPTRFRLLADGRIARGFMLQALPADRQPDPQQRDAVWQHLNVLADTLTAEELMALDNQTLLHRLYHQEDVRLFDPVAAIFKCSCSAERSGNALVSLGREDALALLDERGGEVEVDCQFCNARYCFDRDALEGLFEAAEEHARGLH